MAKKAKFVFKDEYEKAKKIGVRNATLGKILKLDKEVVRGMAEGGRLSKKQLREMFKPESLPADILPAKDQEQE